MPHPVVQPTRLRDLSPSQWRSGAAAWLGWMFDGLDMHLYTLVAIPFVALLLGDVAQSDPQVKEKSAWIQFAFLLGWALGGGFFGRIGDRLGRSRALMLTILVYAGFTGLSFFAQTWWQLFICRFLAALGIGGEWAVGASLLSETWPKTWRPWLAAVLQTGVNIGVLLATLAGFLMSDLPPNWIFLVGLLPALLTLWIRKSVPETAEWTSARSSAQRVPGLATLFHRGIRRTTILTMLVCALALTAHWAFMFWCPQLVRTLPDVVALSAGEKTRLVTRVVLALMAASIVGNFTAAALANRFGYRRTIALLALAYGAVMAWCFSLPRPLSSLWPFLAGIGLCQGVFALFTMYLPPLFPTLLRTTGAGFCYNIGRIAAAFGTVYFGLSAPLSNMGGALFWVALLFVPAVLVALLLPEGDDARAQPTQPT